ncbi:MAG: hypothetical protein M5U28_14710 [Sandaracinaceae bacterium]|nr:hypothetical protein [Sandaracinaceae bacterium]
MAEAVRRGATRGSLLRRYAWVPSFALMLAVWWLVSELGWVGRTLVATPAEVAEALLVASRPDAPHGRNIWLHAGSTLGRAAIGWGSRSG